MAIQFVDNVPHTLFFPYGDGKAFQGEHGVFYAYKVKENGNDDKLNASEVLHNKLMEAGVRKGCTLTVTRVPGTGNAKNWRVEGGGASVPQSRPASSAPPASSPPPPDEAPPPSDADLLGGDPQRENSQTAGAHGPPPKPTLAQLGRMLFVCIAEAGVQMQAQPAAFEPWTTEDQRQLGVSLFIEARKNQLLVPAAAPLEEAAPSAAPQSSQAQMDEAFPMDPEPPADPFVAAMNECKALIATMDTHERSAFNMTMQLFKGATQMAELKEFLTMLQHRAAQKAKAAR